MHGDWTIDVFEPDGRLVQHHEFKNALLASGWIQLRLVLSRTVAQGEWGIDLHGSTSPQDPCLSGGSPSICGIVESTSGLSGSSVFKNLSISLITGGIRLSGTATAAKDGDIGRVETFAGNCAPSVAPASCVGLTGSNVVTSTTLGAPVAVTTGQQIVATVNITFS